mgnify:CR=1 FL=1
MDVLSIIGIILAFAAVLGGNFIEGGHVASLFNLPAAMIVIGGTLGAAILHTARSSVMRAIKIFSWVFNPPRQSAEETANKILLWSMTARKEGLLRLLVDGTEPEAIRSAMQVDLYLIESRDLKAARFYECMGGYAPTIGIIGAVMGLIHVMRNLADPGQLGSGIATAFVATIYGVGFANLLLLPVANKLKGIVQLQYQHNEMLVEGVIAIAEGENPRSIEMKLQGYLEHS